MKFHVLTLFPELILSGVTSSILGRAIENGLIECDAVNIRDFTQDKHKRVDDYTYGGGAGMLMQAQPVYDAWKHIHKEGVRTIYVTPQGRPFTQKMAQRFAEEKELIFLCGHYEGIDERVLEETVTDYVSIGDYVLTGGELPAMIMIDAISRLVPGVLHNETSASTESFFRNLLEYPQYSRPEVWQGKKVPEVLLQGDHKKIEAWRLKESENRTRARRPDLYERYVKEENLIKRLSKHKLLHIDMIRSLRNGKGEIRYDDKGVVLIRDESVGNLMVASDNPEVAGEVFLYNKEWLKGLLEQGDCLILHQEHLVGLLMITFPELKLDVGVYKQFVYTQNVGIRLPKDDSPLAIAKEEIKWINQAVQEGGTPWVRIPLEETTSADLQEKLGLYPAKTPIYLVQLK